MLLIAVLTPVALLLALFLSDALTAPSPRVGGTPREPKPAVTVAAAAAALQD